MEYLEFKKLATKYVQDNHGGLETLKSYNHYVQNKVHSHMLKLILQEYEQNHTGIRKAMNECANLEKRFFEECLK